MRKKSSENHEEKYSYKQEQIEKLIQDTELQKICANPKQWIKQLEEAVESRNIDQMIDIFRLLGSPIRMKILLILMERDWACNCEFESVLKAHQTLISHNLRQLRSNGFVTFTKQGQWKLYSITKEGKNLLEDLFKVMNNLPRKMKK